VGVGEGDRGVRPVPIIKSGGGMGGNGNSVTFSETNIEHTIDRRAPTQQTPTPAQTEIARQAQTEAQAQAQASNYNPTPCSIYSALAPIHSPHTGPSPNNKLTIPISPSPNPPSHSPGTRPSADSAGTTQLMNAQPSPYAHAPLSDRQSDLDDRLSGVNSLLMGFAKPAGGLAAAAAAVRRREAGVGAGAGSGVPGSTSHTEPYRIRSETGASNGASDSPQRPKTNYFRTPVPLPSSFSEPPVTKVPLSAQKSNYGGGRGSGNGDGNGSSGGSGNLSAAAFLSRLHTPAR